MTKKKNKLILLPVNILALIVLWALLSFTDTISPQFQMRPAAQLAERLFGMEAVSSMSDAYPYSEDWKYQGYDYMYWHSLVSIFDHGEE